MQASPVSNWKRKTCLFGKKIINGYWGCKISEGYQSQASSEFLHLEIGGNSVGFCSLIARWRGGGG